MNPTVTVRPTAEEYLAFLADRFGGCLASGAHEPDGQACALEARSQYMGLPWTDDPTTLGQPDYRPINDALPDEERTEIMVPLQMALWDWSTWSKERQREWYERVLLRTIREVLPVPLRELEVEAARVEALEHAQDLAAAKAALEALVLVLALDLDLDCDRARALALALDIARAIARDIVLALALDIDIDLDLVLDLDRALASSLAHSLDLAHARNLARVLDHSPGLASARARAYALNLAHARNLAHNLARQKARIWTEEALREVA